MCINTKIEWYSFTQQWVHSASNPKVNSEAALWMWVRQPWLRRYWFAEGVGLAVALLGITVAGRLTSHDLLAAVVSVYGGAAGYYGALLAHTLYNERQKSGPIRCNGVLLQGRTLLLEMGGAELLDSFCFSPLLLYFCLKLLPNQQLALVLSESMSTLLFYATVFAVQETIRKEESHPSAVNRKMRDFAAFIQKNI